MGFDDLPVVPLDDGDIVSPEADVEQAAASAIGASDGPSLAPVAPPRPVGMSWRFEWGAGRFVRAGSRPAEVRGTDALAQRVLLALYTQRFKHPGVPHDFGFDGVDGIIGSVANAEAVSDFERAVRECVAAVPGCVDIADFEAYVDTRGASLLGEAPGGAFVIKKMTVLADSGEKVPLGPVSVAVGR